MRLRDVLALPSAYRAFGFLVGVSRVRAIFAEEHVQPRPGQRVLDLGCGPGSLVPFLTGVDYVGVDSSAKYIAAARALHPGVRFLCESISGRVAAGESFDLVLAGGLIHHLTDTEALEVMRLAAARLRPGGRLLTLDPCFVDGQSRVARWLLIGDRGHHVRSADEYLRLARLVFADVSATIRHDLLWVPYTHLIMECSGG